MNQTRPILRLGFADTFGTAINFFTDVLGQRYQIVRDDQSPDYLIFGDGNFGMSHARYSGCKKIFYTGENVRPTYSNPDFALTFDHIESPQHYRLPLYVLEMKMMTYEKVTDDYLWLVNERPKIDWEKEYDFKFGDGISYLQGNPNCSMRTHFVEYLLNNKQINVDCGGRHLNNIGKVIPRNIHDTLHFLSKYRFNIAFENGAQKGYTTEKILNAFYAKTLPIYWGNLLVDRDFNTKSFIQLKDFKSFDECTNYVKSLDKKSWCDIMSQPVFLDNVPSKYTDLNNFLNWWETFVL